MEGVRLALGAVLTESARPGGHPPDDDAAARWEEVRKRLLAEVGAAAFNSWIRPLTLAEVAEGRIRVEVPTRFMRDWVQKNYAPLIRSLWQEGGRCESVEIALASVGAETASDGQPGDVPNPRRPDAESEADSRFTFENFVVGNPNRLAYSTARKVAEATEVPFNPLYLAGGVGLGKTHLMHAIAAAIRAGRRDRRALYMTAEQFMNEFIKALRFKNVMAFKERFRSVDVLLIDDVQFIAGKESTQEEFFHTFNALIDQNRQVVISGDRSPSNLDNIEERMRSRLGWGLVADIHATDYELRLGILENKAEQMGAAVPHDVLEFLALRIASNVRELEGGLRRVLAYSNLVGRPIQVDTTREVLRDLLRANDRRVSIEDIQKHVAQHFGLRVGDMLGPRKTRAIVRPRQVAMYLCRQLTSRSLPEIGNKFGKRDHTTVIHAINKVEELRSSDPSLDEDVTLLRRALEH